MGKPNVDKRACVWLHNLAARGELAFYEIGAGGQKGFVVDSCNTKRNLDRPLMNKSAIAKFMEAKWDFTPPDRNTAVGMPDMSDAAAFLFIQGYGGGLKSLKKDGSNGELAGSGTRLCKSRPAILQRLESRARAAAGGSGPGPGKGPVFIESNGRVVVEAENFSDTDTMETPRAWYITRPNETPSVGPDPDPNHSSTAVGKAYIEGLPDTHVTMGDELIPGVNHFGKAGTGPRVDYRVVFSKVGRYFVRVRARPTGSEDNSVHVGINGDWPTSGERVQWCGRRDQWTWSGKQRDSGGVVCGVENTISIIVPTEGEHTISFSMREDGFEFDRFVLTTDPGFNPTGKGPAESARQ